MSEEIVSIRWDDDRVSLSYSMSFMGDVIKVYHIPRSETPYQIEISHWAVTRWERTIASSPMGMLKPQRTVEDAFREAVLLMRKYKAAQQLMIDQNLGERAQTESYDPVPSFISSAEDDGYHWNKRTGQWEKS